MQMQHNQHKSGAFPVITDQNNRNDGKLSLKNMKAAHLSQILFKRKLNRH